MNGVPSPNGAIVDVTVGPGFVFNPSTVNISFGVTVRWTGSVTFTVSPAVLLAGPIRNLFP